MGLTKIVAAIVLLLFFPQGAAQTNANVKGYSCTVRFVPANPSTDRMAGWEAILNVGRSQSSTSVIWTAPNAPMQSPDKRVADAACRDFFAERARHRSPAEDAELGK